MNLEALGATDAHSRTSGVEALVAALNGYQPLDADMSQAFFESRSQDFAIATKALGTLELLASAESARVVVLTGNAGHGKTHLCAQVIAILRARGSAAGVHDEFPAAARAVIEHGRGDQVLATTSKGRSVFVIRDLSEFSHAQATQELRAALDKDAVTIVCANEGRLRYCSTQDQANDERLKSLKALLDESLVDGAAMSKDGKIAVLNLNHQGVGQADGDESLVERVLAAWLSDPAWNECDECLAHPTCPIRQNVKLLGGTSTDAVRKRAVVGKVFEIAEQCGTVITLREMLIVLSHAVTGGLTCSSVRESESSGGDWCRESFMFHQLLFSPKLPERATSRSRTWLALNRLDPARRAIRQVDDSLDVADDDLATPFSPTIDDLMQEQPKSGAERAKRNSRHREVWRFHRRRLLFDERSESDVSNEVRLGLESTGVFKEISGGVNATLSMKQRLGRALEAMQGVRRSTAAGIGDIRLVDRVFMGQRSLRADQASRSATPVSQVIASKPVITNLVVGPVEHAGLLLQDGAEAPSIRELLNWTEREIRLGLTVDGAPNDRGLRLNLTDFDYLLRVGGGLEARASFSPIARKVLRWLADRATYSREAMFDIATPTGIVKLTIENEVPVFVSRTDAL